MRKLFIDLPLSQLDKQFGDGFPLEEDLIEAVDALLRVHFIYNLNVTDVRPKTFLVEFVFNCVILRHIAVTAGSWKS